MSLPCIFDKSLSDLQSFLQRIGEPPFRAKQIRQNLYRGLVDDPERMTDLPAGLRAELGRAFTFQPLELERQVVSTDKQTRKFLFRLPDGAPVETVLMLYERRRTACISTQSGCAVGCAFCATGQMGFRRSLTGGEIAAQVFSLARMRQIDGDSLTNVVLMGMGEPFLNYDAVWSAIQLLSAEEGFGFGARRMTVSTVGIIPGIGRFTKAHSQVNLAISLHAADDDLRSRLIPINRTYPLADLFAACDEYIRETNRRISLEWALIEGVNDSAAQAHHLADRIRKSLQKPLVHVNLIPLNPTRKYKGAPSQAARIESFRVVLAAEGLACTIRLARGVDIAAGCGQLAGAAEK
ncbi:MAG: 23S rRNA (adenine(2503)-C(2))-methyltransferase RlmN [Anaerolineales bacterium]